MFKNNCGEEENFKALSYFFLLKRKKQTNKHPDGGVLDLKTA